MIRLKILLVLVVPLLVLTGCMGVEKAFGLIQQGDMPSGIKMAVGRDYLWGAEPENNGMWQVWTRYDSIGVYCTMDGALGLYAQHLISDTHQTGEVIFTYRDFVKTDPEVSVQSGDWSYSCTQGFTETQHGYKLMSITPVSGR